MFKRFPKPVVSWQIPSSVGRAEARKLLRSGAVVEVLGRGLLASLVMLAVFVFLWNQLIRVSPFPVLEAVIAAGLCSLFFFFMANLDTVLATPSICSVSDRGINVNQGKWTILWPELSRWNTVNDPETNAYLLIAEQFGLSPRTIFIPDREILEKVEAEISRRKVRDPSLVFQAVPAGFIQVWFRVAFGINLVSSAVAMLFIGHFSVWLFLRQILV